MTFADVNYLRNLQTLLEIGVQETGDVRAHWPDGKPAPTIRITDVVNKYFLDFGFPILTCRPVNLHKAVDEMLWIYQKKSNNIKDLNSHVWDSWADHDGSIGKTYGYQAGKIYDWGKLGYMDQVTRAIHMILTDPMSRHIIIDLWNPADYKDMNLAPCCCWLQFNVVEDKLNMVLYQRSLDMISAGGWDVTAHAALLMMIAHVTNLKPGVFTHFVSNMHIYDRHIPLAEKLVKEFTVPGTDEIYNQKLQCIPKVVLDTDGVVYFGDFTVDHFKIYDYEPCNILPKFEVAI